MSSPAAQFLSAFANSSTHHNDEHETTVAGYTFGPVVGYGATSTIRKAYNAAERDADSITAVKIICVSDLVPNPTKKNNHKALAKVRRSLSHEESIWASLSHEHILPLFTACHTPDTFYFFTLYCPAGSLFDILKRDGTPALLQDDAGMMFRQVVRGLRYLHEEARLVHRDIKLENVLVDEMGLCKIADFGTAKPFSRHFYQQRSSPTVSRSHSRSRPDLEKDDGNDWVDDEFQPSSPATPYSSTSTSTSSSDDDDQSFMIHRASSLSSPRPSHQNRFHRNSTISYTPQQHYSQTLPPSSSYPTHANFRNHNNTKPKAKSKHTRFQPGSLPYAAPELLLLPHPAATATTPPAVSSFQILGAHGHRNKSRSRSKSANRNKDRSKSRSGNHSLPYAKKSHNHNHQHGQNHNRYQPHPGQDIWALGVLLYALLTGKLPFADRFEPRLQTKILSGYFTPPPDIGRGAERILYGCLDKNLSTRWTIAMVDEVAWGVGWGREGDEVGGGSGSDDEEVEAFGANGTNTNGVPSPAAAEQPDRASGLASSSSDKTKTNGANATSTSAGSYTTNSRSHAVVTFVDDPELYAGFDDDDEEELVDSPDGFDFDIESKRELGERGRGRKGIPVPVVAVPCAR